MADETMTEKERYQRYLTSREWGLLKRQVKKRSGGICERCWVNPSDAVHHLTYERKYNERLEDLQDICEACHKYTHGLSDVDPRTQVIKEGIQFLCKYVSDDHEYQSLSKTLASCFCHVSKLDGQNWIPSFSGACARCKKPTFLFEVCRNGTCLTLCRDCVLAFLSGLESEGS